MNCILKILIISIFSFLISCINEPVEKEIVYIDSDNNKGQVIADTIIYDVIINNRDTLDLWKDKCLQHLKKATFVDSLFAIVYKERKPAYDLHGTQLTPKEIKSIENQDGYSRDAIGKLQFKEIWYFNAEHLIFHKKIISVTMGYERISDQGEFRGYSHIFRIDLN